MVNLVRTLEVLTTATRLGLTSFGGPVAHLGYFRDEYVHRRRWLDDETYADLVALCQFLPGPASSQVGIAIGITRAGLLGGLAAWFGFTLPSAIALVVFAYALKQVGFTDVGWLHGLKLAAVAVVATAVWGMARSLAPDRERGTMAIAAAIVALAAPLAAVQVGIIVAAGLVGWWLLPASAVSGTSHERVQIDHNPFRALSEFNVVLRDIARRHPRSLLVDADRAFLTASAPYAPGFDLFLDYVHPTKRGNLVLAEQVFNTIVKAGLVGASPAAAGFTHEPRPWSEDGKPYDGERDHDMQATLVALCMMMHQYEAALEKARAIVESPHGLAGLDETKRGLVRGVHTLVPHVLTLESRDLAGTAVSAEERANAQRMLHAFYRSVWGEEPR